nr:hypothetical protein HK105_006242 [Polyrhizophydium stewartii]
MGAYDPARMAGQPGRPGHPGAPTAQRMTLAREEVIDPNDSFEPGTLRLIPIPSESAPGKTASAQASPRSPAKSLEKDVRPAAGEGNPAAAEMPGNPAVPTSSAFMGAQPAKSARSPAHPTREHSPSLLSIRMATDLSPGSLVPKSAAEASIVSQIKDLVRDWREQESRFHDRLSSLVDSLEHSRGLHDKPTAPSPARLPSPTIVSPTSLSVSAAEEVPALVRQDAPSLSETTAQAAFEMPARAV